METNNPYEPPKNESNGPENPTQNSTVSRNELQTQGKVVVLATFEGSPEAHCLRNQLELNGIRAAVTNETSAQTVGGSLFGRIAAISIEVVVLESDIEAALKVKSELLADTTTMEIPEWTCACGETVDAGFAQCWSCMEPHPDAG